MPYRKAKQIYNQKILDLFLPMYQVFSIIFQ